MVQTIYSLVTQGSNHPLEVTMDRQAATIILLALALPIVAPSLSSAQQFFDTRRDFPVGNGPESVAIGNLNSDDSPDLVTLNVDDATISVLLGEGSGIFQEHSVIATGNDLFNMAVGDLDGNGNDDLVVTREYIV